MEIDATIVTTREVRLASIEKSEGPRLAPFCQSHVGLRKARATNRARRYDRRAKPGDAGDIFRKDTTPKDPSLSKGAVSRRHTEQTVATMGRDYVCEPDDTG